MANLIIEHADGRRYEVSEQAYHDLYVAYGFGVEGVLVDDANGNKVVRPYEPEEVKAADAAIEAVPDHQTQLLLSMANTDIQTNGVSKEVAYAHYGLELPEEETLPIITPPEV